MNFINRPKKSLSQNFLIDQNIISKIVKISDIKNKTIMEIGSGYGNLTKKIVEMKPKKLFAIEKDKNLSLILKDKFKDYDNIKIINNDILNIIESKNMGQNIIIFGNLPYNISTQILAQLLLIKKWPPWYRMLILMFQKEVADRIIAKENTKEYGRLSILCNWRMKITKHFDVSKNCFFPRPRIKSSVLSFTPKENIEFQIKNPKHLEKITRILFSNRRKIINKNFLKLFENNTSIAEELNINLKQRPEELNKETFYNIAMKYENLFG